MSAETVNTLVAGLVTPKPPTVAALEARLGTSLKATRKTSHWTTYEFSLPGGPFAGGEFRLGQSGDQALLSLKPGAAAPLTEDSLDLTPYGAVKNIDINPQIPPEGTDAYIYQSQGVRVSFQFMHDSRRLRTLVLEWAPPPKAQA